MQPLIVAEQVRQGVADFLATTFPATTAGFETLLARFLAESEQLAKGPFVTIGLPFRKQALGPTAFEWLQGFDPHAHQARAFDRLAGDAPLSTLVATGTGSGKTECFLYPVLEHCRQMRKAGRRGIKAVLIYPMNALATDQANRVAKEITTRTALAGITAGLYVGDEPGEKSTTVRHLNADRYTVITDRERLREEPPDILLTNYRMLDFLLIRARDAALWRHNAPDTLRFLVVDELHAYDGAQGTDLACLIRRLKARLRTPPGTLACVGTSATLGVGSAGRLIAFARDVFAEPFDDESVIGEDRVSVTQYLEDSSVEFVSVPEPADLATLSPLNHDSLDAYVAAQYGLWFGASMEAASAASLPFRVELGSQLKRHVAFQNLLRDLNRLGVRAVLVKELTDAVRRRLRDAGGAQADFPLYWLVSLLTLVAHASKPTRDGNRREAFLTVRVELWLRELRRMVATLSAAPSLVHSDDLPAGGPGVHLPVIHCRDCHVMGWGATQSATDGAKLKPDLRTFYAAFFSEDVTTRFIFPAGSDDVPDPRKLERRLACTACGTLNPIEHTECGHCGSTELLRVDVARNLRQRLRHGGPYMRSHHDCPYCQGDRTLTIVGSQAASLASVAVGQLFGTRYNSDKKLIAFSDSVQDAAHRAGFFEARTWRLNLRPAMAQVIHDAVKTGSPLTLAELPTAFERRWLPALGEKEYIKTFLPPSLSWLRDYQTLLRNDALPDDGYLQTLVRRGLTWTMLAEFGQDAHVGRTLPRTRTACVVFADAALSAASAGAVERWREKIDGLRGVTPEEGLVFLDGFLARVLRIGAIWDDFLVAYARRGCNIFVYRTNPAEFALLKTPRRPRFLSLLPFGDCDGATGEDAAFYRDWTFKTLSGLSSEASVDDTVIADIYRIALQALESQGIVRAEPSDHEGTFVWGVQPAACALLGEATEWRCDRCHNSVVAPPAARLEGTPCRQLGCRGAYRIHEGGPAPFYRQLYLSADICRIVAHEHTALLDRATRERVEGDFKTGRINLLSATPTLEMGIDIGDLSGVLLGSVPPTQANYLQRVGRAGRATGNAFLPTLAAGRPHDLYFWAEPKEMLAGQIEAPGVFLNASAVLERQLTAFTLDTWVREYGKKAHIPTKLSDLLSAVKNRAQAKFPYTWLTYVDVNRATLLEGFLALFTGQGTHLTEESIEFLRRFIEGNDETEGSLAWKVINCVDGVIRDLNDLRRRRNRVEVEITRMEGLPALGESDQLELKQLRQERAALTQVMASVSDRDTLQFLTDEGLLPNYAFPEQGVLLQSVVVRDDRRTGRNNEERVLTFEYERPGASAITELAPNNAFYAEGRKVTIDQVDVSRSKPAKWRFCRSCSYTEVELVAGHHTNCPRCGDAMWADAGRLQTMLRLTKVYARTFESRSRIGDDADDRERHFYVRQALIDVVPDAIHQAWAIDHEEFPFAFEFVSRIRFREVNFGEQTGEGQPIQIAGSDMPRPGFVICPDCGTVQRHRKREEAWKNHALYCSKRREPDAAFQECVFLYREFDSEGIRIYLPESAFGESEQCVHSFIAAMQMGLERQFRGSVDHLRIARDVRIAQGQEAPRQYLVIYDSVPGGTGYLKQLMRDSAPLLDVFQCALDALTGCGCNSDPTKDGCYRCLYTYHNSNERRHVSRRTAVRLLTEILAHRDALRTVDTISNVRPRNSLFDSELERRFIEALRRPAGNGTRFEVREEIVRGKAGYFVKAGERTWTIEPQVDLGRDQGVVIASKPDFVLWPETVLDSLPIAVFLDGWKFHRDRVGDDIAKRMAIARSGRFTVWTLTADDIATFLESGVPRPETPWAEAFTTHAEQAAPMYQRFEVADRRAFHLQTAFEQLRERLAEMSDDSMQRLAVVLALRLGAAPLKIADFRVLVESPSGEVLAQLQAFAWPEHADLGRCWNGSRGLAFQIAVQATRANLETLPRNIANRTLQPCTVLRWADDASLADIDRRHLWQQWWHAANLLMPIANTWPVADEGCAIAALAASPVYQAVPGMTGDWEQAAACASAEVQALLAALFRASVIAPIVGYELLDIQGCVVADVELAWPAKQIAVQLVAADAARFEAAGWRVYRSDLEGLAENLAGLLT